MRKLVTVCLGFGLMITTMGCASNSCGPRQGLFQNQPIRNTIRSWFTQGDPCNTCNPPVGRPNCGTNVAPLCETCGQANNGLAYGTEQYSSFAPPVINDPGAGVENQGVIMNPGPVNGGDENASSVVPPNF